MTFTNKAAEEMRERIDSAAGKGGASGSPERLHVSLVLRPAAAARRRPARSRSARLHPPFTIYDDDDQLSIIKAIYQALGLDEKFMQYRAALRASATRRIIQQTPQDFYKTCHRSEDGAAGRRLRAIRRSVCASNALDFDDLLLESVRLLQHDESYARSYNARFSSS